MGNEGGVPGATPGVRRPEGRANGRASVGRSAVWGRVRVLIGRSYLLLSGWRAEGSIPGEPRYLVVAAPHTSYWDFVHMMAYGFATGQHISYLMKHTMFRWPLRLLLEGLGGIPVDRSVRGGLVAELVEAFGARDELVVVIAPDGTRARQEHWKSGFYHAAHRAGVPLALGYLDYARRAVGIGPLLWPCGDVDKDMAEIGAFYRDKRGKHPERETPPRMRAEHDSSAETR